MVDGINTSNEGHEWRVPMSQVRAGKLLILSNDNDLPVSKVEIEKMN
jgi:hypothetical protein